MKRLLPVLLSLLLLFSCSKKEKEQTDTASQEPTTTESGLQYFEMETGDGEVAEAGNTVTVHYTGTFTDGKKFDSSLDRSQPFVFTLGAGEVIQGWDEGIQGMKVGGKRKLIIPPDLAYGEQGMGGAIPPNSTLVFVVELLKVSK